MKHFRGLLRCEFSNVGEVMGINDITNRAHFMRYVNARNSILIKVAFISILFFVAETPNIASATADGPDFFAIRDVKSGDTLTVREKPTARARKIGTLPPKARGLKNLGCVDVLNGQVLPDSDERRGEWWCKVRSGDLEGWVSGRFLTEDPS